MKNFNLSHDTQIANGLDLTLIPCQLLSANVISMKNSKVKNNLAESGRIWKATIPIPKGIDMVDIKEIASLPEGKTIEFKRDLSSMKPILKTLVAFANTAGGILLIGKDNDGTIIGVKDVFEAEEKLANAIADSICPPFFQETKTNIQVPMNCRARAILQNAQYVLKMSWQHMTFYEKVARASRPL